MRFCCPRYPPLEASTELALLGSHRSAEEAEEALEDGEQRVNNIVHSFRLTETSFDKKSCVSFPRANAMRGRSNLLCLLLHPQGT